MLADELGYHCVWEVEHHGLYEYSHSSAPEVFLSFVAARTKRIRLGHGVTLTPHRYNHPIRIAERIATLDILSEGRVNWGSGKSSSLVEQRRVRERLRTSCTTSGCEALEMIPRMWRADVFEWKGRFFDIPPTRSCPKPVQQPHPPMFAACSQPEIGRARRAAWASGSLNFAVGTDESLEQKVARVPRRDRQPRRPTRPAREQPLRVHARPCWCWPTTARPASTASAARASSREALGDLLLLGGQRPVGPLDVSRDPLRPARARRGDGSAQPRRLAARDAIIGDPVGRARDRRSASRRSGVDELILVMQMGTVPHELVMESLRTFARAGDAALRVRTTALERLSAWSHFLRKTGLRLFLENALR